MKVFNMKENKACQAAAYEDKQALGMDFGSKPRCCTHHQVNPS